ncbi:hypothetical protein BGZ89_000971 [Linnemannia elongata]|nr:hypothetical protein BGZ89_000971 [Linnemannia elongata]
MSKTFHGRVDETVDALIILEACRQGVMPRITRRLLAAERGETLPLPNPPSESSSSSSTSSSFSTRMSSRLSVSAPATAASISSSPLYSATVYSTSSSSTTSSPPAATTPPSAATPTNPSLIIPGSVFVFDEEESGICRWTDGKIWSPSRICDNFLVYRELYRKLPNQKCYTASDKAKMKDGSGLKDQALKEKVDKENLVVMGCMKGTFVLKKGGLVKKTICVKGINLVPPEELKRRLEGPALGLSSSSSSSGRRGSHAGGRGRGGGGGNGRNLLPGFSTRGTQHLVCYEIPGEMDGLHGPREYLELRDLPISKTFVMMQSYRVPMQILPLDFGQQPLDPADEYIHSSRIFEARSARQSTPLASSNTASEGPFRRRKPPGNRQRKRVEEEVEEDEGENEPDYIFDDTNSNCDDTYDDSGKMTASGPILPPIGLQPSQPPAVAPVYHNYPTRGQDRYIREQIRQQLMESRTPSPPTESTPKGKKRKMPLSRSLAMETEDNSAVKVEKSSPSLGFSYSAGRSAESGGFLQHDLSVRDDEMGEGQDSAAPGMPSSSLATRGTPSQMNELLQSMNTIPLQGDNELKIHGYKTAARGWRLVTSSRTSTSNSAINDPLAYARSTYNPGHAQSQPVNAYPYHEGPHWHQQDPSYSPQPRSWDLVAYNQMSSRMAYYGLYPAQQISMQYNEPQTHLQPQNESLYQTLPQQQAFSNEATTYYNAAPASTTMMPPMQDLQGYYSPYAGAEYCGQPFPLRSDTTFAGASDVIQQAGDSEMERSDDAGYSPVQVPSARAQGDSPWSSGSVYSRSSSLSTSLTLSPVMRPPASAVQGARPNTGLEAENQPSPVSRSRASRQGADGMHTLTDSRLWHDEMPPCARPTAVEQVQSTMTTNSSSSQGQAVSVSFTHTARSSSTYIAPPTTPISASAATTMPTMTPVTVHMRGSTATSTSAAHTVDVDHHDQQPSSSSEQNPQPRDQPFQVANRTFRRRSLPHVPVMSFSSGIVLGTCAVDSRQGSPMDPLKEVLYSAVPAYEFQANFPEVGANELSIQEQEQVVTDEEGCGVESYSLQMQDSSTSKRPTQISNKALINNVSTTPVMIVPHQVQRPPNSAAGPFRESAEASSLSHQTDSEPYSSQPRREYMHPPNFLFHDVNERDELDRLLDYHPQRMGMLGHDEGEAMECHEHDGGHLHETGGYDGPKGSERVVQQTIPSPIDAHTEGEQPSGRSQLMSPETLSALHHYSQEGPSSMRSGSGGPPTGPVDPMAPSLSLVSSSGSLGQDEYLLHQTRPHICRQIRRHGHGTGTGVETSLGIGFGSSDGYGYMPGSGGGGSSGGLRSSSPGTDVGTDADGQCDRSEDLPWAMSRQEDTTSSEIACQLFSGLGPARGRGRTEEGQVYASGMGVGIGTAIGGSYGGVIRFEPGVQGSSGETVNGRAQSAQTLQLSDPVDRYSLGDEQEKSPSHPASPSSAREEKEQEEVSGSNPRSVLIHRGHNHIASRLRLEDSLIEQEEVKDDDDEDDELEVLVLYSEHSSENGSSVQEHYNNNGGGEEDDMGQGYDDRAEERDVDFAQGQIGDRRNVVFEVNGAEMFDEQPSSQVSTESENWLVK